MAKTSIIIPTYNHVAYLGKAIRSALDQDLDDLEVVVVDDGSTDDTRAVVSRISDGRLAYVYQPNQGATAAFNRGISESTGEYVGILGSDDWYLRGGLAPLLAELDRRPELGVVSGGLIYVDEAENILAESRTWERYPRLDLTTWLFSCPLLLQTSLIRREWIERVGGFDPDVRILQDWDFGLRLAAAGCPMSWIEQFVFCYRLHPKQSIRDARVIRRDNLTVLDKFYARPDSPSDPLISKSDVYAHALVKGAIRAYDAGQVVDGRADLERAIQVSPRILDQAGQQLFDLFVGWASDHLVSEPATFIQTAFSHLPDAAAELRYRRREAMGAVAMAKFFGAHARRDPRAVRTAFAQAMRYDRSWLLNRGVLSIALEAGLGRERMQFLRNVTHSIRSQLPQRA